MAVGALLAVGYVRWQGTKINLAPKRIYDLFFYVLIAGLMGGRLGYVIINAKEFDRFLDIFKVWEGGLVFYGSLISGSAVFLLLVKLWKLNFFALADIVAPAIVLAHGIGRVGCFFAGCCYGAQTSLPWGVIFTNADSLAPLSSALHPTQLYSAIGNIAIFVWLHLRLWKKKYDGEIILWYLVLYGIFRFSVEFFRADFRGPEFLALTLMQYVSLIMAGSGLTLMIRGTLKNT